MNQKSWNLPVAALGGLAVAALLALTVHAADTAPAGSKRELLSSHQTVAQFEGITEHKCLGKTSQCPDRCGSSGDLATFKIVKYLAYEKPGQYGDAKQTKFSFLVQDNMKNVKVPAAIKEAVESLKPGDYVRLNWRHDYVTGGGSSSPERPIESIKQISKEEADKLAALPETPAAPKK